MGGAQAGELGVDEDNRVTNHMAHAGACISNGGNRRSGLQAAGDAHRVQGQGEHGRGQSWWSKREREAAGPAQTTADSQGADHDSRRVKEEGVGEGGVGKEGVGEEQISRVSDSVLQHRRCV